MADPKDPDSLSLAPSGGGGEKKADFSNVQGKVSSTAEEKKADFSNVESKVSSTAQETSGGGGGKAYTVEKGDNLSAISKRVYGSSKYWKQIYEANRDSIENPDLIYPGQTINLPDIDTGGDK